jgi:hypothetical protein
MKAIGRYTR